MKKRSFRSTFVSVILVITVAISIVNLAVYGINIKKIRQVEVLKMKTAGERIDDMITISLNNIKGLKQICCTDNYARNILLKNNEKNDIGTKFENQNYMDNALKHIASMDTLILRATIVNKYGNIYCTDTSIPEEYVKTIRNMTKEWMLFEGKEDEYYYGGLQGDNANILTFLYPLHTYGNTPIALLAVDINYKTFQSILENAFYENSGECFILTGEQELFHIGEDLYQKEEKGYIFDKSQKMMKENLIVDTFQSKGKNFYISSRQNMLSGWKIIQVIPEERLFEEVDQKIKWNTAPCYGNGTSEKIVGEVLKEIPREQVLISTKFGLIPDIYTHGYKKDTSYKNAMREIQSSLMNLETDYIDFYFVHWPDVNTPIDETMAALEEMKRKGYIRYVGVSNFTAEQIKEAEQYIQIDVQQPLYSMVDRGFEDLMSWGYDRGIDSMTYGSMGAGILSGKIRSVPSFEKNDLRLNFYDVYKEPKFSKIMELLKVMDSIADGHNVPVGQVALNWSTQKEYVGTALVGVRSIEHADENCKTFDWKLTEEEMKILDSKIEECAL